MQIAINIPEEYEEHFNRDRFKDSLERLYADANLLAGRYEIETAKMLIKAFKNAKIAEEEDMPLNVFLDMKKEILLHHDCTYQCGICDAYPSCPNKNSATAEDISTLDEYLKTQWGKNAYIKTYDQFYNELEVKHIRKNTEEIIANIN